MAKKMVKKITSKLKKSVVYAKITAAFCALLLGSSAMADFSMADINHKEFRAGGIYLTNSSGDSFSGVLSWNPSYAINSDWSIRGNVGASALKGTTETFIMSEYGLLAGYKINSAFEIELGAGMQNWSNESTASMMNLNVLWNMGAPVLGLFDRVFAGYTTVNQDTKTTELKLGVTITFGSTNTGGSDVTK